MKQTVRGELVELSSTVSAGQPVAYRNRWFDTFLFVTARTKNTHHERAYKAKHDRTTKRQS
jgi:hypothetical protein